MEVNAINMSKGTVSISIEEYDSLRQDRKELEKLKDSRKWISFPRINQYVTHHLDDIVYYIKEDGYDVVFEDQFPEEFRSAVEDISVYNKSRIITSEKKLVSINEKISSLRMIGHIEFDRFFRGEIGYLELLDFLRDRFNKKPKKKWWKL